MEPNIEKIEELETAMEDDTEKVKQTEIDFDEEDNSLLTKENFDEFLTYVGLQSPIDFVFLNYAMSMSRQKIDTVKDNLLFLFHIVTSEIMQSERPFPRCAFVEKVPKDEESKINVLWTFSPSKDFESREIQPFSLFHSYFMNVLKPNLNYTAHQLYEILKQRKGESYFLNHGPRSNSVDEMFHILFVTPRAIIAFQVPPANLSTIDKKDIFMSKWVSMTEETVIKDCCEYEIFACPRMDEDETEEIVSDTKMDESQV
jgi:hypothetical protein